MTAPIVPINQRFFEGGDTFRGFALAGIGPRDIDAPVDQPAPWAATSTPSARWRRGCPTCCRKAMASTLGLFTDFGTLGRIDNVIRACTPTPSAQGTCVKDNLAFRASAGISFGWKSPFGPLQIDLGTALRQDQL